MGIRKYSFSWALRLPLDLEFFSDVMYIRELKVYVYFTHTHICVCVCVWVRACVRACVRAFVRVFLPHKGQQMNGTNYIQIV